MPFKKTGIHIVFRSSRPLSELDQKFLRTCADGAELTLLEGPTSEIHLFDLGKRYVFVSDQVDPKFFSPSLDSVQVLSRILLTADPMEVYSVNLGLDLSKSMDLIIGGDLKQEHSRHELRAALQKIICGDLFGLEKYLVHNCPVHRITLKSSDERELANNEVQSFAEKHHLSSHFCRAVSGISEEFLTNAIYSSGQNVDRHEVVHLDSRQEVSLRYGFDGEVFALSVEDHLGRLKQDVLMAYVHKILLRNDSDNLVDTKKSGAGLGFFKILYSCHALICNTDPGVRTEFISLIYPDVPLRDFSRMSRSICFFSTQK